ncbi:MAG: hypothetical protein COA54_03440 [Thiotrichaceae bacterium]|nr:MAG: hypothetical protein COA54_03440 [Thiotrichaceae bacterium]
MYRFDPRFLPQQFKTIIYSPVIIISHLSEEEKNSFWQHLKENHPKKANSLASVMSDPFVELIMDKKDGLGGYWLLSLSMHQSI